MPAAARTPRNVERYRTRLRELKTQLEADFQTYRERAIQIEGGPDEPGAGNHWERSGYGDHLADDATEVFEKEKSIGMEQDLAEHIRSVDHALARIDAGTYGACENCGKPIAKERLDAMPEAALCIECQAQRERENPAFRPTIAMNI
jgi:DnaK suppressor protein